MMQNRDYKMCAYLNSLTNVTIKTWEEIKYFYICLSWKALKTAELSTCLLTFNEKQDGPSLAMNSNSLKLLPAMDLKHIMKSVGFVFWNLYHQQLLGTRNFGYISREGSNDLASTKTLRRAQYSQPTCYIIGET